MTGLEAESADRRQTDRGWVLCGTGRVTAPLRAHPWAVGETTYRQSCGR